MTYAANASGICRNDLMVDSQIFSTWFDKLGEMSQIFKTSLWLFKTDHY